MTYEIVGTLYALLGFAQHDNGVILHRYFENNMTILDFEKLILDEEDAELRVGELCDGRYFPVDISEKCEVHGESTHFFGIFVPENSNRAEIIKSLRENFGKLSELSDVVVSDDNIAFWMLWYSYKYELGDIRDLDNRYDKYDYSATDESGQYFPVQIFESEN